MSRKRIDIAGQRFGRLVAIADVGTLRSFRVWSFQCDCGAVVERPGIYARTGRVSSCGCLQSDLSSARHTRDIEGQKFGRLTVVKRSGHDAHGHVAWLCVCECGTEKVITGILLRKGATKSCGCLHREHAVRMGRSSKKENPVSKTKEYRKALVARLRRDPCVAIGERISRLLAHAMKAIGVSKGASTFDLLGYTPEQLRLHIERQFLPGMSWENRCLWHIDHIIPISIAKSKEDVVALNQLSNLRPLWAVENNKKRAKRTSLL